MPKLIYFMLKIEHKKTLFLGRSQKIGSPYTKVGRKFQGFRDIVKGLRAMTIDFILHVVQ